MVKNHGTFTTTLVMVMTEKFDRRIKVLRSLSINFREKVFTKDTFYGHFIPSFLETLRKSLKR